ncbi:DUF6323 family protein [Sinanaerobacter chloroacetimidivorans]|jgi:hypothetical protein|uniref:Uncharacterized protein n=1 Tax=Sinanaerobacter chloroacetimidivorans TaxID=2818044 RepID=A0A8J7VXW5_9FIRM|nr:DUF6323 family protein [Sinanaerobacter chloroacetimidivorans]MBR0597087.1 hypothetical protein [Sinanaerobacter chloroacetimidivorans]
MSIDFLPTELLRQAAITEVLKCNEITARYGLSLSAPEVHQLVETRDEVLKSNGRIEFSGGIINKLIIEFCDSPYLSQFHYAPTLNELIETFYYFKNESLDEISDDELLSLMKEYFDRRCQGSIELLQSRELELLARNIRYGTTDYTDLDYGEEEDPDREWDEEDWDEQY